jgi:hypothetical protein
MAGSARMSGRLSALAYFTCVALVTALGFAAAVQLRPPFGHSVRQLLRLEKVPQANPDSFYTMRVTPLLVAHCTGCHGARMQKAQLRLDGFAALMRGGRHGAVIRPGDARNSELFFRITLPLSDDKVMPPSGKVALTQDEITVFKLWIAAGASGMQRTIKGAPKLVAQVKIPEADPQKVQRSRAPLAEAVRQLQSRLPGIIDYESRSSADLEIDASLMSVSFGDAELGALAPLQDRIVRADFSGTAITDASAPKLATMNSLRVLRLTNTKIGDATIRALISLKFLRSLTVVGTAVTANALAPLRQEGVAIHGDGNAQ